MPNPQHYWLAKIRDDYFHQSCTSLIAKYHYCPSVSFFSDNERKSKLLLLLKSIAALDHKSSPKRTVFVHHTALTHWMNLPKMSKTGKGQIQSFFSILSEVFDK